MRRDLVQPGTVVREQRVQAVFEVGQREVGESG